MYTCRVKVCNFNNTTRQDNLNKRIRRKLRQIPNKIVDFISDLMILTEYRWNEKNKERVGININIFDDF